MLTFYKPSELIDPAYVLKVYIEPWRCPDCQTLDYNAHGTGCLWQKEPPQ